MADRNRGPKKRLVILAVTRAADGTVLIRVHPAVIALLTTLVVGAGPFPLGKLIALVR